MKKLRQKFERFCYKHRNKGIPNLMLYVVIGNAIVYLMSEFANNNVLYDALCFRWDLILKGEVWRLITCIFTTHERGEFIFFLLIGFFFYYTLGKAIENRWGTFRFNLFYFSGLLLMEAFVMLFGGLTYNIGGMPFMLPPDYFADLGTYLNLSLFIAYATLYPDTHFLLFLIIPVKAWILALFNIAMTILDVIRMSTPYMFFPINLFPLVALANYFLFFGKDVLTLIPISWQANARRLFRGKKGSKKGGAKVIPFPSAGSYEATTATVKAPYTHKCVICGRTDISDPDLEFRYCSRCKGFHCYCEDHINNHTHIDS